MSEIVIYPNNSVTVDGRCTSWSEKEFRSAGIEIDRPQRDPFTDALRIRRNGDTYLVFPTRWKAWRPHRVKRRRPDGIVETTCLGCRTWRPLSEFNRSSNNAIGVQGYCRSCSKEYMRSGRMAKKHISV